MTISAGRPARLAASLMASRSLLRRDICFRLSADRNEYSHLNTDFGVYIDDGLRSLGNVNVAAKFLSIMNSAMIAPVG